MAKMKEFLDQSIYQDNPIKALKEFLDKENSLEKAKLHDQRRFVGYVLDIGFGEIRIITNDPLKVAVGGIPRNSLLIMCPSAENIGDVPPHFTLLRILDTAPTPLSEEVQQTYFELHKRSMPELDVFTQSELQWGALKAAILGMFYPHPQFNNKIEFSGDINNYVSAHRYKVYAPDDALLNLINNSIVPEENRFQIGKLRLTECRLEVANKKHPNVDIFLSTKDFMGSRTAMFGKTRLGKSNVVKLIAQSLIETTKDTNNVGQLIFDINGEYSNDNPQDDNFSLRSAYPDRCIVYALTPKENTPSRPLKMDFYENPDSSHKIISTLLREAGRNSIYVENFRSVDMPSFEGLEELPYDLKKRANRKILLYWAILNKAGFPASEKKLKAKMSLDPKINADAVAKVIGSASGDSSFNTLDDLTNFFEKAAEANREEKLKSSTPGKNLFDPEDESLLNLLKPSSTISAGPGILKKYKMYHDTKSGNFVDEILEELDKGKTVILDLGNANEEIMQYYSRELSQKVFNHQTMKFTENRLKNHFVQLYFEEAHNLFKEDDDDDDTKIYRRFAKEGAKYHIGMVYSTQSPTTINSDLLAQTENFFIAHLASIDDVNRLARVNVAYESMKNDILQAKTVGYIRMLTRSHRFVVSLQALKFAPPKPAE